MYQTSILKPHDIPRTYVADTCQYLKNKWDPNKSAPGTVVMVIMHHGINKGDASGNDVTVGRTQKNNERPVRYGISSHQHAANGGFHV
jgi:hypothetical protein